MLQQMKERLYNTVAFDGRRTSGPQLQHIEQNECIHSASVASLPPTEALVDGLLHLTNVWRDTFVKSHLHTL